MKRTLFVSVMLGLIVCLGTKSAAAEPEDEARAQYQRGVELYDEGKYDEASVAFSRAYELKPSYRILFNIAQTDNQRGEYTMALESYRRYLVEGGEEIEGDRRSSVEKEVTRLESLVGALVVDCQTEGTVLFVDGRRLAEFPFDGPVLVNLGERDVSVKHGSRELFRELIRVAGGQEITVVVDSDVGPEVLPLIVVQDDSAGAVASSAKTRKVLGGVLLGVAGASAIVAGVTGGLAMGDKKDLDSDCEDNGNCPSTPNVKDKLDGARTKATLSTVFTCVGGATLVAGVILLLINPDGGEDVVSVTPTASAQGAGLVIGGRF